MMLVGVSCSSLSISAFVREVVNSLLQLIVIHLMAILTFRLFAVLFHHLFDSLALRLDSIMSGFDCLQHHRFRNLFHLALNHHDVVIRSSHHQLEVCSFALFKCRVNHHLAIYACYTHFAHGCLERYIRASQSSTSSQTGNRLRHIYAICRIHRYINEGLCVIVGWE